MALTRRSTARMSASIWPGFVDAMTALLLVLMFVLSIFMIVQGILRETITGQESELDQLAGEITALGQALGLSQQQSAALEDDLALMTDERSRQAALIANLTGQIDSQARALSERDARIADFESQVATLLTERDEAREEGARLTASVSELEDAQSRLIGEQEALNLALARARDEIDSETENARLAAARADALEALTKDLRAEVDDTQTALNDEEQARLAEAAAAEALRERLENSEAELTAMSLALEEQRREAEETLTLLAAAEAVEADLNTKLGDALIALDSAEAASQNLDQTEATLAEVQTRLRLAETQRDTAQTQLNQTRTELSQAQARLAELGESSEARDLRLAQLMTERDTLQAEVEQLRASGADEATLREQLAAALSAKIAAESKAEDLADARDRDSMLLATAQTALQAEEALSAEGQREVAALNAQVAALRSQLGGLQVMLDAADARDADAKIQIDKLGGQLNTALARAAQEQSRRAELEAAEAERLRQEAELLRTQAKDLENYRSNFFGEIRRVLGDREGVQVVGDRFVFSSEVLFEPASAQLSPEGRGQIAQVESILSDVGDQIPEGIDWIIRVDGHTDNVPLSGGGLYADNWELSQARALSVVKYMTDVLGFPPERLAATGFGEYRPVNTEDTSEARAQNRRIELKLTER